MNFISLRKISFSKKIGNLIPAANLSQFQKLEGKGQNSKIYIVTLKSQENLIVKFYPPKNKDQRERLKTEFSAFQALWNNQIRQVPKPLNFDYKQNCAVYSYLAGKNKLAGEINKDDILQVVNFVKLLKDISKNYTADCFQHASEACFSLNEVFSNIEERLKILNLSNEKLANKMLTELLLKLQLCYSQIKPWAIKQAKEIPLLPSSSLTQDLRVLSPSDFGFHNAVLDEQSNWSFLDFEYFGWDDPIKLIIDFMLHPAMNLSTELSQFWLEKMLDVFFDYPGIEQKLKAYFPLLGIKWCCILLNCFVPSYIKEKKHFLSKTELKDRQLKQVKKADMMLSKINNEYCRE